MLCHKNPVDWVFAPLFILQLISSMFGPLLSWLKSVIDWLSIAEHFCDPVSLYEDN